MGQGVYTRYVTIDPAREADLLTHRQSDVKIHKLKRENMWRIEGGRTSRHYIDGLTRLFANGK